MTSPAWERIPLDDPAAFAVWLTRHIEEALETVRIDLENDPNLTDADVENLMAEARPKVESRVWEEWLRVLPMVPQ